MCPLPCTSSAPSSSNLSAKTVSADEAEGLRRKGHKQDEAKIQLVTDALEMMSAGNESARATGEARLLAHGQHSAHRHTVAD